MIEKPTIEEHAKNMEDAWRSAEEQNIIFSRKIDALKGAVRSAVQQINDRDEVIERLRGALGKIAGLLAPNDLLGKASAFKECQQIAEQALGQADGGE